MLYAKLASPVVGGEITEYPITETNLRKALSNISLPADLSEIDLVPFGYAAVPTTVPPIANIGHRVVLDTPIWNGNAVERTFKQQPLTAEEQARRRLVMTDEVNRERDRRIQKTFTFNGSPFQLDDQSVTRITAMGSDSRFAIAAGAQAGDLRWADPDNDFGWITTDNAVVPMDAPTMSAFADAAKLWVSKHITAARAIKDMDPIPSDHTDDSYWPVGAV